MLMKPARSGVEAPPEKNTPGCPVEGEVGKGPGMIVVVVVARGPVFVDPVGSTAARVAVVCSLRNRLEGIREKEDMAGGQGCGTRCDVVYISPNDKVQCPLSSLSYHFRPFPTNTTTTSHSDKWSITHACHFHFKCGDDYSTSLS